MGNMGAMGLMGLMGLMGKLNTLSRAAKHVQWGCEARLVGYEACLVSGGTIFEGFDAPCPFGAFLFFGGEKRTNCYADKTFLTQKAHFFSYIRKKMFYLVGIVKYYS